MLSSLGIYGVFIALYYAQLAKLVMTFIIGQQCIHLPFQLSLMVALHIISGLALFLLHSAQSIGGAIAICVLTCALFAGVAFRFIRRSTRTNLLNKLRAEAKRVSL